MNGRTTSHDRVLAQRHAEGWMFLIETARDLRPAGAAAPSGNALARALTEPVRVQAPRPLAVLEAGAGAVTRSLISQLPQGSRLDIVEANPRFATQLRHLVTTRPAPAPGPVTVRQTYLEDLDTENRTFAAARPLRARAPTARRNAAYTPHRGRTVLSTDPSEETSPPPGPVSPLGSPNSRRESDATARHRASRAKSAPRFTNPQAKTALAHGTRECSGSHRHTTRCRSGWPPAEC